jgi:hypothetical protein
LRLGHDFDALGRLTLVRYPSGALGRYRYDGPAVLEDIDGADGKEIQARRYELDPRGLRLSALDTAGLETLRVTGAGSGAYTLRLFAAGDTNDDGQVDARDFALLEAVAGATAERLHAWSVAEEMLTVGRSPGPDARARGAGSVDLVFVDRPARPCAPGGLRGASTTIRGPLRACAPRRKRRRVPGGTDGELRRRAVRGSATTGPVAMVEGGAYAGDRPRPVGRSHRAHDAGAARGAALRSLTGYPSSDASGLAGGSSSSSPAVRSWNSVAIDRSRGSASTDGRGAVVGAGRARATTASISILAMGRHPGVGASGRSARRPGIVRAPTDEATVRVLADEPSRGHAARLLGGHPPIG